MLFLTLVKFEKEPGNELEKAIVEGWKKLDRRLLVSESEVDEVIEEFGNVVTAANERNEDCENEWMEVCDGGLAGYVSAMCYLENGF